MGKKYVIEMEEEPFVSELHSGDPIYRVKGFRSLVFDKNGISKLKHLSDKDCINQLISTGWLESHDERLIEQTWDLCREIMNNMTAADARNAGLIEEGDDIAQVLNKNTCEKARWRYNHWKERTRFKPGDVVKNKLGDVFIVINITDDRNYFCLKFDLVDNCSYYCTNSKDEMQHMVTLGYVDFFTKGQGE